MLYFLQADVAATRCSEQYTYASGRVTGECERLHTLCSLIMRRLGGEVYEPSRESGSPANETDTAPMRLRTKAILAT